MNVRFPTDVDIGIVTGYLEQICIQRRNSPSRTCIFDFTRDEVSNISSVCENSLKCFQDFLDIFHPSLFTGTTSDDEQKVPSLDSFFKNNTIYLFLLSQCNMSYFSSYREYLSQMLEKIKLHQDALIEFNSRHGYIWTVDYATLINVQKDRSYEYLKIEKSCISSRELMDTIDAIKTEKISDFPSKAQRDSYCCFLLILSTLDEWVTSFLAIVHTQKKVIFGKHRNYSGSTTGEEVLSVKVHDLHQVFQIFLEEFKEFFQPEFMRYDSILKCYTLKSSYICSYRECLKDFGNEILSFEELYGSEERNFYTGSQNYYPIGLFKRRVDTSTRGDLQTGTSPPLVLCEPSIDEFNFLYICCSLLLSIYTYVDTRSSELYFDGAWATLSRNADVLKQELSSIIRQASEGRENCTSQSTAEVQVVQSSFGLYRDLRKNLRSISSGLEADLVRTQRMLFCADPLFGTHRKVPIDIQKLEFSVKEFRKREKSSQPLWKSTLNSFYSLLSSVACKAEYDTGNVNTIGGDEGSWGGFATTVRSPGFFKKGQMLKQIKQLEAKLEKDGILMEKLFPETFSKSAKDLITKRVFSTVKKFEPYSVVFEGPS